MKGYCVYIVETCFAKEFYSSNFEDAVLCFSTVTIKQLKRSISFSASYKFSFFLQVLSL